MDRENIERLEELLEEEIDWPYLQRLAAQHNVMPLLYQNLRALQTNNAVPRTILDALKQQYVTNTGHNLSLTRELLKLMSQFNSHGIRVIAYKGPVLAASAYHNIALRQFSDLDILVNPSDFWRSTNLLDLLGYRPVGGCDWEINFSNADKTMAVDLHRAIMPRQLFSLAFDRLWERHSPTSVLGRTVASLSVEDTLVVLCAQIAKDGWEQKYKLSKVCDINEFIQAHPNLNWEQILTRFEKLDCRRMLFLGLSLANDLLKMSLPKEVIEETQRDQDVANLTKKIREQFFTHDYRRPSWFKRAQFHARLREKKISKISFFLYIAAHYIHVYIVPNEDDRNFVTLPPHLNFIYYFVKPVRLLHKYSLLLSGKLIKS